MWHERVIYMGHPVFYIAGHTDALDYATKELAYRGCTIADTPGKTVTHLLLPVPSFNAEGALLGGEKLTPILELLSRNVTILCGNPGQCIPAGYKVIDFLQDPLYLAENADITAHCAVKLAMSKLPMTMRGCHILVVGWGRIGKCLAALLKNMGANVTVAARKEQDRAMLTALGYETESISNLGYGLLRYDVIFNTVPAKVLPESATQYCKAGSLKIDLATQLGIEAEDVIWARGLPNKEAPVSSGKLIARTALRFAMI